MISAGSIHKTNTNLVNNNIIYAGSVDLGSSPSTIVLGSNVVSFPGTYVLFRTYLGITWNGSLLAAGDSLVGKINFQLPVGYAIQAANIASNGLDAHLIIRRAVIAA